MTDRTKKPYETPSVEVELLETEGSACTVISADAPYFISIGQEDDYYQLDDETKYNNFDGFWN